jgi:ankyrin repeat protein
MISCSIGSLPIVTACIQNGSDIKMKDTAGRTALHYCAAIGNLSIF